MRLSILLSASAVVAATCAAAPVRAESLYKCDADGAVTIQSEPCPKGSTQVWMRETTPDPGPTAEELAAKAALAAAEAQQLAERARLAEQERIAELLRRDDEARLRAAEAEGGKRPERKSGCTLAHEFQDAALAKEWLNLSQTQRDRLRAWVIEQCKDPLGRPLDAPTAPAVTL
jgi:hypothetical protein